jgi:hypothetical protein
VPAGVLRGIVGGIPGGGDLSDYCAFGKNGICRGRVGNLAEMQIWALFAGGWRGSRTA